MRNRIIRNVFYTCCLLTQVISLSLNAQVKLDEKAFLQILDLQIQDADLASYPISTSEKLELGLLNDFLQSMLCQNGPQLDLFENQLKNYQKQDQAIRSGDSFQYLSFQFRLFLYQAILSAQYSSYSKSAKALLRAYRNYRQMLEAHPAHPETRLAGGVMKVLVDQLPDSYLKYLKLVGVQLPPQDGFIILSEAYRSARARSVQDGLLSGLLWVYVLWEFHPDRTACWAAWEEVASLAPEPAVVKYTGLAMAIKAGKVDDAFHIIDQMEALEQFERIPMAYYLKGRAMLYQLDVGALQPFGLFLTHYKGDNYVKSTHLFQAWIQVLNGNPAMAQELFLALEAVGTMENWADQQAARDSQEPKYLNKDLLSIRLLYDGGYYTRCLQYADSLWIRKNDFSDAGKVEVLYRIGLCQVQLDHTDQAIDSFISITSTYDHVENYQLPKAALQAARLYANAGRYIEAVHMIETCLHLNRYGHQSTFTRQAQSLRREIENR